MSTQAPNEARVIPLRPQAVPPADGGARPRQRPAAAPPAPAPREPLWRDLVGDALRRERLAQERTLKDVAEEARISMPYLSELERGRKEASSEVLAAAARALGLGLGDLISLAQDELARYGRSQADRAGRAGQVRRSGTAPTARYDGLCLAA
ncbi:transcriptional regulator [Kitasatospora xanthocidica]|uniref:helix-turn-helix domain-containing protein n=1 Tax=Kitasatospora xanthocidica TaxID=83382 RepID=UPI00167679B7|nr:helix-turn-helix transcriptional regulator [Kitasatospora xanthocidica]GHF88611.1 transcriptional regulator [Kitasatospora xanthocidica]